MTDHKSFEKKVAQLRRNLLSRNLLIVRAIMVVNVSKHNSCKRAVFHYNITLFVGKAHGAFVMVDNDKHTFMAAFLKLKYRI